MSNSTRRKYTVTILAAMAIAVVASGAWYYLDRGRLTFSSAHPDRSHYPVRGIDISSHNGDIDFSAVAADSVDFVIIKATEGATFKDKLFTENVRRAGRSPLAVGAYHFFRFDSPGHMQALNFLNSVRGRRLDLPLFIDVEEWGNPNDVPTDVILDRLSEMTDYIASRGYRVIIYTNKDGYERFLKNMPGKPQLWICSFTDPPGPAEWRMWQHTHRGSINGIDGHVDINAFNGSRDDWREWLDSMATPPAVDSLLKVR